MTKKKRIIRFITYYRLLPSGVKGQLKTLIEDACEFKGGTFGYKLKNGNYSELQLREIETIIQNHKDGKIEML
jgi:hypothetical protein